MSWKLDGQRAVIHTESLEMTVDLSQPRTGIANIKFHGQALADLKPLQVTANPPVSTETIIESYVRGQDLVATYAQLPERTVRPQIYYHVLGDSELADERSVGVELVIGIQTSLLDSDPTFSSITEAAADELHVLTTTGDWDQPGLGDQDLPPVDFAGAFVFRLREPNVSYIELILPADFQGAKLSRAAGVTQLGYQLFPEFLEKGVIRKGRMWAVLSPRQRDLETADRCLQQLLAAPPPLTV